KLIAYGSDRAQAIARLERALESFKIGGVRANIPLLLWIARDEAFRKGDTTTSFLAQRLDESIFKQPSVPREATLLCVASLLVDDDAPWRIARVGMPIRLQSDGTALSFAVDATATPGVWFLSGDLTGELRTERRGNAVHGTFENAEFGGTVMRAGTPFDVHYGGHVYELAFAAPPSAEAAGGSHGGGENGRVVAPMPGKIVKIAVREGDSVEEHALLVVLEAMKMEHRLEASTA